MEKKRKRITVGFCIAFALVFLLMSAVLELNKNTLLGFAMLMIVSVLLFVGYVRLLGRRPFYVRFLFWPAWLALFALIVFEFDIFTKRLTLLQ